MKQRNIISNRESEIIATDQARDIDRMQSE